jgi:UTP--glucose-1-phosphate uridylyltransferase
MAKQTHTSIGVRRPHPAPALQDGEMPAAESMRASVRMANEGLPAPVIHNFQRLFSQVLLGNTGIIEECSIDSVGKVDQLKEVRKDANFHRIGMAHLEELAVIRLNGGLGSSMGMSNAKSLLPMRWTYL